MNVRMQWAVIAAVVSVSAASADTVEVTASALNVRTGPSTGYSRVAVVYRGQQYERSQTSGSWSQITVSGRSVWAHSNYLRRVATNTTTTLTVTASALNVRSGPSTRYRVVGQVTRGQRVAVTGTSGDWRQIRYGSGSAWVHGAYLSNSGVTPPPTNSGTSSAGFIQLPNSGNGYFGYYAAGKRWGTTRLVYGIQRIARRFAQANPGAPRIGVGDISLPQGGPISGHASHQRGVDADLRPLRNDGREGRATIHQSIYSRTLTQRVLDLFVDELTVTHIFFNDRQTRHTQPWPNHDNHFHVRIR